MGASSDLGQPLRPRQKRGFGDCGKNRLSRYDIHADGALSPSITVIARLNIFRATGFAMFLLRELIPKYKYVSFEFLMKVIVALILNELFRNIKGNARPTFVKHL